MPVHYQSVLPTIGTLALRQVAFGIEASKLCLERRQKTVGFSFLSKHPYANMEEELCTNAFTVEKLERNPSVIGLIRKKLRPKLM